MDIKKNIQAQGSNISKVAKELNISQSALSQQINHKSITVERVREIAKILGCSPASLIADEPQANNIDIICPHCGKTITLQIKNKTTE